MNLGHQAVVLIKVYLIWLTRFPFNYIISGFILGVSSSGTEVALVYFKIASRYKLIGIPILIIDDESGYDLIIGNNVVHAHRWSTLWKEDEFFIHFNNPNHKPVKASFSSDTASITVTNISFELQPNQLPLAS